MCIEAEIQRKKEEKKEKRKGKKPCRIMVGCVEANSRKSRQAREEKRNVVEKEKRVANDLYRRCTRREERETEGQQEKERRLSPPRRAQNVTSQSALWCISSPTKCM